MKQVHQAMLNSKGVPVPKRAVQSLCLLLCILCLWPVLLTDQGECASRRHVRVGYYIAKGFQDYDKDTDTYSGSGFEYLMALKQYTNWDLEFVPVEFSQGVDMLERGELDLMNNVSKTAAREKVLAFSRYSSGANYGVLAVDAGNTSYAYNDYAAFAGMRIGMRQNSIFRPYFEDFCRKYDVHPQSVNYYASANEMNTAMDRGDIDTRVLSSSYRDNSRIVAKFAPMEYYFAVPKAETALLQELNSAMENVHTDLPDLLQRLDKKYNSSLEPVVVLSAAEKQYVQHGGIVKVAVDNDWAPVAVYQSDGCYTGALADIFAQITQSTGLCFQFVPYESYAKGLDAAAAGEVNMVAHFPDDFVYADKQNLQLSDRVAEVTVYRVIKGSNKRGSIASVGLYDDGYLAERIRKHYGNDVQYISYPDVQAAMNGVLSGDVDCTFIDHYAAIGFQNKGRYLDLKYLPVASMQYDFVFGVGVQENPLLKSIIAKALQNMGSGYIDNIFQREELANRKEDLEAQIYHNPGLIMILFAIAVAVGVLILNMSFYNKHMRRKNQELEQARNSQREFLSRMSHDMRTPMNGILGLSYLMEKESSIANIKSCLPQLQESSRYLMQLINDVLDVNKISSGHMTLSPRVCDEEKVFNSIVYMIEPQMAAKEIKFNFIKKNIHWKYMLLDEQRVKQIFMNLLNNAVKFTPRGGQIDLYMELVSETETVIRDKFVVRDNGIGIGEEFLPHVFEAFRQEYDDSTDYSNGTGLGLSIVKKLVELMEGTIQVSSEKGKGTSFTLFLNFPLASREDAAAAGKESAADAADEAAAAKLPPGLKILLCEDHPLNADIAVKLLEAQGASVVWAENGQEGADIFARSAPGEFDLIIMDIRMPVLDGLSCAGLIREMERADAGTVPIIAMSANAYQEDIDKSLAAGMNAHIAKPVEPQKLYAVIRRLVS